VAGTTFTVRVVSLGFALEPAPELSPGSFGGVTVAGGAWPSGAIPFGSFTSPVAWPQELRLTASGEPGATIEVAVSYAGWGSPVLGSPSEQCVVRRR
jgi:hypothetical protein